MWGLSSWCSDREDENFTKERLESVVENSEWCDMFGEWTYSFWQLGAQITVLYSLLMVNRGGEIVG